jgi:hypothetical protein
MPVQSRLREQSSREGAGDGRLPEARLADEKVCMRQPLGRDLRSELI